MLYHDTLLSIIGPYISTLSMPALVGEPTFRMLSFLVMVPELWMMLAMSWFMMKDTVFFFFLSVLWFLLEIITLFKPTLYSDHEITYECCCYFIIFSFFFIENLFCSTHAAKRIFVSEFSITGSELFFFTPPLTYRFSIPYI